MMNSGISDFSYNDWAGNFYPVAMPRQEWLTYYAPEFNTGEVNSTFDALPKPSSLKAMAEKTDERLPELRKLDSATEKTFVFANNHWHGQSVGTIRQLQVMLD
ncbi:MAG: hypothetical protein HW399_310 [Dehalococcoidia bacterium]|nr:hypothetical protein [Dehalococcoidia bacterium]